MAPRGNEGYDFQPLLTPVFLTTFILAIIGWLVAFIGQAAAEAQFGNLFVNVLWFAIFLQLALIAAVLHTLASNSADVHRFQISIFGAIAIVFAVIGVNMGIFEPAASLKAMGAGWLLLAMVDIIWVLYFTSEEDSLMLHLFNSAGSTGLAPPSRNRRRNTRTASNMGMGIGGGNGYATGGYSSGGIGPSGMEGGFGAPRESKAASIGAVGSGPGMNAVGTDPNNSMGNNTASQPLMSSAESAHTNGEGYQYRARALYAYTASPDDPNEISFSKGEVMEIVDNTGKWWQARKADGSTGIAPSNYLQLI